MMQQQEQQQETSVPTSHNSNRKRKLGDGDGGGKTSTGSNRAQPTEPGVLTSADDLHPYDILCGRCTTCYNNVGNRRFRLTISMNVPAYVKAKTKTEKGIIIKSIIRSIQDAGGRFYRPKGGCFIPLSDSKVREKVGHALRDLSVMTGARDDKRPSVTRQSSQSSMLSGTTAASSSASSSTFDVLLDTNNWQQDRQSLGSEAAASALVPHSSSPACSAKASSTDICQSKRSLSPAVRRLGQQQEQHQQQEPIRITRSAGDVMDPLPLFTKVDAVSMAESLLNFAEPIPVEPTPIDPTRLSTRQLLSHSATGRLRTASDMLADSVTSRAGAGAQMEEDGVNSDSLNRLIDQWIAQHASENQHHHHHQQQQQQEQVSQSPAVSHGRTD